MTRVAIAAMVGCALAFAACGSDDAGAGDPDDASGPRKRVFTPRPGRVRAVPPHNLAADGIGPYRLGATLKDVFGKISDGPRLETLYIDEVFHYSLVRTEKDGLLIGAARMGGVQYLAAIQRDIVHTEHGEVIGLTVDEVDLQLGAELAGPRIADPRLRRYEALPDARFITDGQRVEAVLLRSATAGMSSGSPQRVRARTAEIDAGPKPEPIAGRCEGLDGLRALGRRVVAASRLGSAAASVAYGCADGPIAVVSGGDRIAVVAGAETELRGGRPALVAGLMFAAPLDTDGDGRDEIIAAVREETGTTLAIRVDALAADMTPVTSKVVYEITASDVALIGGDSLAATEFLLEIRALGSGELQVGGIYLQRVDGHLQNVVPLDSAVMEVRRRPATRSAPPESPTIRAPLLPPPPRRDAAPATESP